MNSQAIQEDRVQSQPIHSTGLEPIALTAADSKGDENLGTFWDDPQFQIVSEAPHSKVSQIQSIFATEVFKGIRSKVGWGSLVLVLTVFGAGIIWFVSTLVDIHPLEYFASVFQSFSDDSDPEESPVSERTPEGVAAAPSAKNARDDSFEDETDGGDAVSQAGTRANPENPYWSLPNSIVGGARPGAPWTIEMEERWRAGIVHKYPYQRLKTVQKVRRERRIGSQAILWEALGDKKEWVRMFAAVGLAEFDTPVSTKVLLNVIGRARSELIAGFLERFVQRPNAGQAYLMRQLVRLLDARGRLVCLRAIWNTQDPYRDLYVAAGTLDPNPEVRSWLQSVLLNRSMPLARYDGLVAIVRGEKTGEEFRRLEREKGTHGKFEFDGRADKDTLDGFSLSDSPPKQSKVERSSRGEVEFWDAPAAGSEERKRSLTAKDLDYDEEVLGSPIP